jgi:hypothetical protein
MPASHFDVNPMTGRPKFIVRHSNSCIGIALFLAFVSKLILGSGDIFSWTQGG